MPVSLTPDNTAAVARPLAIAPLPLPGNVEASVDAFAGTGADATTKQVGAANDNTPPDAITG